MVHFKIPKDAILKMSYIKQAERKEKCDRLFWFVCLLLF